MHSNTLVRSWTTWVFLFLPSPSKSIHLITDDFTWKIDSSLQIGYLIRNVRCNGLTSDISVCNHPANTIFFNDSKHPLQNATDKRV